MSIGNVKIDSFETKSYADLRMPDGRAYLFDLDGTLVQGNRVLPGARELLEALASRGVPYAVITNNTALSRKDHARRLKRLGLPVSEEQILTSAIAAAMALKHGPPVYLLGTPALACELGRLGVDVAEEGAEAVLVGFDTTLSYERLRTAALLLEKGALFLATHPDPACPSDNGNLPDAGGILALLEKVTGRHPDMIFGKPNPSLLLAAASQMGLDAHECFFVGDRAEVDVPFAQQAGAKAGLVLTGATPKEDPRIIGLRDQGVLVVEDLWTFRKHVLGF